MTKQNEEPNSLLLPKLNYLQIEEIAEDFLKSFHPSFKIPIPIEEIVEHILEIRLSTETELKKEHGIDGFINSKFDEIVIDDRVFNEYEERTRFTIAHELGHKILHERIYRKHQINSKEEYILFQNSISEEDQGWLEFQANTFAASVLVPKKVLIQEFELVKSYIGNKPLEIYYSPDALIQLPLKFKVSQMVIAKRLAKLELINHDPK